MNENKMAHDHFASLATESYRRDNLGEEIARAAKDRPACTTAANHHEDTALRAKALELAYKGYSHDASFVVKRAQVFYEFLKTGRNF